MLPLATMFGHKRQVLVLEPVEALGPTRVEYVQFPDGVCMTVCRGYDSHVDLFRPVPADSLKQRFLAGKMMIETALAGIQPVKDILDAGLFVTVPAEKLLGGIEDLLFPEVSLFQLRYPPFPKNGRIISLYTIDFT